MLATGRAAVSCNGTHRYRISCTRRACPARTVEANRHIRPSRDAHKVTTSTTRSCSMARNRQGRETIPPTTQAGGFLARFCVKYEEVYLHEYATIVEAVCGFDREFRFYNGVRLHQTLGYGPPATEYVLPVTPVRYHERTHGSPASLAVSPARSVVRMFYACQGIGPAFPG